MELRTGTTEFWITKDNPFSFFFGLSKE
jgi:hypothetical protein